MERQTLLSKLFRAEGTLNDTLTAISVYFSQVKLVLAKDKDLYSKYIKELTMFIVDIIGIEESPFLKHLVVAQSQDT